MKSFDRPSPPPDNSIYFGGHYNEPDTYVTKRPHGMNSWLITFTLEGEGYFLVDNRRYLSRAGDIALLKPGAPHQYGTSPGRNWNFVWAHFDHIVEAQYLNPEALSIQHIAHPHIRKRMYRLFQWFLQDARERLPHWQELCAATLKSILLLMAQRQQNTLDSRVEMTLHLLTIKMKDDVKVEKLAQEVGLSASRLSHLFKDTTGETIIEALNRIRLNQAALLLEHTDRNASEAAYETGFRNYNHFAAQFVRRFGMTPGAYKRQFRGEG
jgi:AraC-type DNA-binding domain-containing proteins